MKLLSPRAVVAAAMLVLLSVSVVPSDALAIPPSKMAEPLDPWGAGDPDTPGAPMSNHVAPESPAIGATSPGSSQTSFKQFVIRLSIARIILILRLR